jgi:hypothetical protein
VARTRPEAGCHDLAFQAAYSVDEAGEVALEDYARTLGRAAAAEAVRSPGAAPAVTGVHLCAVGAPLTAAVLTDIEDFARSLSTDGTDRRGWS